MPRRKKRRLSRSTALWLLAVLVSFALGGLIGSRWRQPVEPAATASRRPPVADDPAGDATPTPAISAPVPPASEAALPRGDGARVALVIDDLGRSVAEVESLDRLPAPITYSVLPFEHSTAKVVAEVKRRGGQLLCHLPMQPATAANPGPGALNAAMSDVELSRATAVALDAVEGAVGANHHMGSLMSTDERSMRVVIGVLAERGLFYLDSKTSSDSVGYRVGRDLGVPSVERQVFLDPDRDPQAIRAQFRRLLELAAANGSAVAIGHPYPETVEMLDRELPRALAAGFEFVELSALAGG